MTARRTSRLLAVVATAAAVVSSRTRASLPVAAAFAGGFDGGRAGTKAKRQNGRSGGKKKKARKKGGLSDIAEPPAPSSPSRQQTGPKLDRWGLPEATVDDIFPPLHPSVELIPVRREEQCNLEDIQLCLKNHIDLKLSTFFDEDGVERSPSSNRYPCKLRLLHRSPPVLSIDNFFTPEQCDEVRQCTADAYQVDSATFQGALSTRTSTSWFCNYRQVPTLLAKAHKLLNIPIEVMEEPQIVRYRQGQQFSWHYDEVPPPQLPNGGQRLATLLVYLNDIESGGGGTVFRDLRSSDGSELTMQPKKGSALLFFPAFADGRADDRTLHKGDIMTGQGEEKWIVQMWIHERSYQASLPPGNMQQDAMDLVEETVRRLGYVSEQPPSEKA